MNTKFKLMSVSALLALTSCGGNEIPETVPRQPLALLGDAVTGDAQSPTDITITSFTSDLTSPDKLAFEIQVTDIGPGTADSSDTIDTESLSFALEYSQTADFKNTYRTALFDQQVIQNADNSVTVSARSSRADLPSGNYSVRIVVNPDWHMYIENNFQGNDLSEPLYYISESNYLNNYSSVFNHTLETSIQCTEDVLEQNNSFVNATALTSGSTISASLCHDNADYYALALQAGQTVVLNFAYDGEFDVTTPTQYAIVSDDYYRQDTGVLEGPESQLQFDAAVTGTYYLAIYGRRSDYVISRDTSTALAADWFFTSDTVAGPTSPAYGAITLNRLNFTSQGIVNKTASCKKEITDPLDQNTYITPPHFPDIHEVRFLDNNIYLIDGESRFQWSIATGDISNDDWYENPYPGWAENLFNGSWRYWDFDGRSYVECKLR